MKRPLVIITAALALAALPATTAYADPTDPPPGWKTRFAEFDLDIHMGGDGGAHVTDAVGFPGLPMRLFAYGPDGRLRTTGPEHHEQGGILLATGSGDYAVAVMRGDDLVARTYTNGVWSDGVVLAESSRNVRLGSNPRGDTIVTWADGDLAYHAARLVRGESWRPTEPLPMDRDRPWPHEYPVADPVINATGKSTVVWFDPSATGGRLLRSVLQAGGSRWSPPQQIAVLKSRPASLELTTDGKGRETVAAGSRVWRQVHPTSRLRFLFQAAGTTEVDLDASGPRTRAAWMTRSGHTFRVKSRMIVDNDLRPTTTVWTKGMSRKWRAACYVRAGVRVAVSPQGRSYLAWGVVTWWSQPRCSPDGGGQVARVAAINGADRTVGSRILRHDAQSFGTLSVTAKGPVALTYDANVDPNGINLLVGEFFAR